MKITLLSVGLLSAALLMVADLATMTYDLSFYSLGWCLAFVGGVSAVQVEGIIRGSRPLFWPAFWIGVLSGHAGVITVGLLARAGGATIDAEPFYLAIAAGVGLFGRQSILIPKSIIRAVVDGRTQTDESRGDLFIGDMLFDRDSRIPSGEDSEDAGPRGSGGDESGPE